MDNCISAKSLSDADKFELIGIIGTWLREHGYSVYEVTESRISFENRIDDKTLFAMLTISYKGHYNFPVFNIGKDENGFSVTYVPEN